MSNSPTIPQVMQDPDFRALPMQEQTKVVSHIDPDYAALPAGEQTKALMGLLTRKDWGTAPQSQMPAPSPQGMANQAMSALGQKISVGPQPRPNLNMQQSAHPTATAVGSGVGEVAQNTMAIVPQMLGNSFDPGGVQEGRWDRSKVPAAPDIHNPLAMAGIDKARLESASKEGDVGDVLTQTGNAIGPMLLLGRLAPEVKAPKAVVDSLNESAATQMGKVLSPTTKGNKFLTQKVAPELVDRGFTAMTRGGAEAKAAAAKEAAGQALDEAWSKIPEGPVLDDMGKPIPGYGSAKTKPILDALEQSKEAFKAGGVAVDAPAIERIQSLQDIISKYGEEVSPQTLRKVRQIWDTSVSQGGGYYGKTLAEGGMLDAKREAANAIRNELANQFPDLQKVNGEYNFWANVDKVLQDTKQRKMGQSTSMGEKIMEGAGTVAGSSHGVGGMVAGAVGLKLLQKAFRSTAWQTVSATTKGHIAQGLANGNFGAAAMLAARATGVGEQNSEQ